MAANAPESEPGRSWPLVCWKPPAGTEAEPVWDMSGFLKEAPKRAEALFAFVVIGTGLMIAGLALAFAIAKALGA